MAKISMSEKALNVWKFLMENDGKDMTAADIAIGMGIADADDEKSVKDGVKSINAVVTSGIIGTGANKETKGYAQRVEAEITLEDGTHKTVKLIELTDAGRKYDHEAAVKADIETAMNK